MNKTIVFAALFFLLAGPRVIGAAEDQSSHAVPAGVKMYLPDASASNWAMPPGFMRDVQDKGPLSNKGLRFDIAPNDKICLGINRILFYPEDQITLTIKVPIQEYTWLSGGKMLVRSGQSLGFLNIDPDEVYGVKGHGGKGEKGNVSFLSRFTLPYKEPRLYSGLGDHFYVVGYNEKEKRNEISAWNLADEKTPATPLYGTESPVAYVAGSPEITYIASGREIFALKKGAKKPESIYTHAREDIRELVYRKDVGLFFTTAHSAGFIGGKQPYEFVAYPGVQLRLRGNALYIRFGPVGNGIVRVEGPAHFADLTFDPPQK